MVFRITFVVVVACILLTGLSEYEEISQPIPVVAAGDLEKQQQDKREYEYFVDPSQWPGNGVPGDFNAYPSYEERAMATWINVVCCLLSFPSFLHFES